MASSLKLLRVSSGLIKRGSPIFPTILMGHCISNGTRASFNRTSTLVRGYAEQAATGSKTGGSNDGGGGAGGKIFSALLGAAIGAGAFYYYDKYYNESGPSSNAAKYQKVYDDIAKLLEDDPNYDFGSYGPVFVRLAWHTSGTYDKGSNTGGSYKGTMRFKPESEHSANAGLHIAREKLEQIKKKYPWMSYGDIWTLAGAVAIQEMGGPTIPWRPGRIDGSEADCPPDGRLPDGGNPNPQHPRDVFYRMGFNDQEITALIGAHTLGKCHKDRSGFDGPWTASPTTFSNSFYTELLGKTWVERKWNGPKQFEDKETKELMMLPSDMTFLKDKEFKKWVEVYAKDEQRFFDDFTKAWVKLVDLGVNFPEGTPEYKFKTLA